MAARIVKISRKTLYQIVKEVRKRPCLWNTEDEFYNNRGRVAVAWDEITSLLNLPEALIRAKWKNMRDLFKRELKKCTVNALEDYTGKWRHFKIMWFLHKPKVTGKDSTTDSNDEVVVKQEAQDRQSAPAMDSSNSEEDAPFENSICPVPAEEHQEPMQAKKRRASEDDYDVMFLKSLVPYFRELDPVRKLRIRNKIQDIILAEISIQQTYCSGR